MILSLKYSQGGVLLIGNQCIFSKYNGFCFRIQPELIKNEETNFSNRTPSVIVYEEAESSSKDSRIETKSVARVRKIAQEKNYQTDNTIDLASADSDTYLSARSNRSL